jgi:hypothetical protein
MTARTRSRRSAGPPAITLCPFPLRDAPARSRSVPGHGELTGSRLGMREIRASRSAVGRIDRRSLSFAAGHASPSALRCGSAPTAASMGPIRKRCDDGPCVVGVHAVFLTAHRSFLWGSMCLRPPTADFRIADLRRRFPTPRSGVLFLYPAPDRPSSARRLTSMSIKQFQSRIRTRLNQQFNGPTTATPTSDVASGEAAQEPAAVPLTDHCLPPWAPRFPSALRCGPFDEGGLRCGRQNIFLVVRIQRARQKGFLDSLGYSTGRIDDARLERCSCASHPWERRSYILHPFAHPPQVGSRRCRPNSFSHQREVVESPV